MLKYKGVLNKKCSTWYRVLHQNRWNIERDVKRECNPQEVIIPLLLTASMLASMLPRAKGKGLPGMEMDINSPAANGGKPSSGTMRPCRNKSAPPSTWEAILLAYLKSVKRQLSLYSPPFHAQNCINSNQPC